MSNHTAKEFDKALETIIGSQIVTAIGRGNRTTLLNMAITRIFLDNLEGYKQMRESIAVIRECGLYLRDHGQFDFKMS